MAQKDLESIRQGYSTKPTDVGVPMSAFAARNAVNKSVIDVTNQHHERPRVLPSHLGAKATNVSPPPVKKQRLGYDQRSGRGEVQVSAHTGAASTVRPPALGLKRKYDSTDVLTASDDNIEHHRPSSLHAQTERQPRPDSVGEEFGSEYRTEVETD